MKILLVNDFESGGGAEVHVQGVARSLRDAGHQVRLLHGWRGSRQYLARLWDPLLVQRVHSVLADFQPDIVHVHKHNLFWGAAPFRASRGRSIPVVCTEHDYSGICPEGWMVRADGSECATGFGGRCWSSRCLRSDRWTMDLYRRFNLLRLGIQKEAVRRAVSCFLAPSNHLVEWVGRKYGPGVRVERMPSSVEVRPQLERRLDADHLEVFVASRLEREKGIDLLVRAVAATPGVRLTVAGEGGRSRQLESLSRSLAVEDRIDWKGRLDAESVREQCRRAHLVVQPSIWMEGGGDATLSILEGMAEGCAVASSGFGESPDVIDHGVDGWIVERGSQAGWERVLKEAASDPGRCLSMGAQGHGKVLRERSPQALLRRLEDVYARHIRWGSAGS